ncbi:MAG: LamG domain-containing protein [Proteobacteria bacterium]|nr:LamG domain-containing protein [Pseudomonadota bacterium]
MKKKHFLLIWLTFVVICCCPASEIHAALIAHWTFDETSGSTAYDTAGSYHGTLAGSAVWVPGGGKSGGAISLARTTGDYVNMGDILPLGTGPASVVLWVNTTTTDTDTFVLSKHWSGFPSGYAVGINSGNSYGAADKAWFYNYHNGLEPISITSINDGQWHQIIATRGNNQVKIYVDGTPAEDSRVDDGLDNPPEGTPFLIGGYFNGISPQSTYSGLVDDVQIYNHMLSDTEIQWLYDYPGQAPACTPPPANMVSWWGGDNNTLDMVGTNHGTLVNGVTYAAGMVSQAFSLDGVDDYVEIAGSEPGDFGSNAFSVNFWMYSNNNGSNTYLLGKSHPDGGQGWDVRLNNNTIQVVGINGWDFNITSDTSATANTWHFISISATDTEVNLYIDGGLKGTSLRSTISSTTNPFRIGYTSNFGGTAFNGLLDEINMFNRALTPEEIVASYNAGSAGICRTCIPVPTDVTAWWRAENNAEDSLGNYDGAMLGATFAPGKIGQAFSLGVNEYVDLPDGFADFTTGFTVGLWANPSASGNWARFLELGNGYQNDNILFLRRQTNDQLAFQVYTGGVLTGTAYALNAIINDEWHYYAATMDTDGNVQLYKDGAPLTMAVDSSTVDVPANVTRTINYIGKSSWPTPPDEYYSGKIDEVMIFNRALSANEIATLYNTGSTGTCDIFHATATTGTGGTVNPASQDVNSGATASFTVTPDSGYLTNKVVGGTCLVGSWNGATYTTGSVTDDCTVTFTFTQSFFYEDFEGYAENSYPDSFTLIYNGSGNAEQKVITTAGPDTTSTKVFRLQGVNYWASEHIRALPAELPSTLVIDAYIKPVSGAWPGRFGLRSPEGSWGTRISAVLFENGKILALQDGDDGSKIELGTYTDDHWYKVTLEHDISARTYNVYINGSQVGTAISMHPTLAPTQLHLTAGNTGTNEIYYENVGIYDSLPLQTHTITATALEHGAISPNGSVPVFNESDQTFVITADANYHIADVVVDGTSVGPVTEYTFTSVTTAHIIEASFALNTYTIEASAGANGSISPSGSVTVNHGSDQGFSITADANYHITDVVVDGTSVGPVTEYTFTSVTTAHIIEASFAIDSYSLILHKTGTGTGTVTSDPVGITCGILCSSDFDFGTDVTLSAAPTAGCIFKGWSGSGAEHCTDTGDCTVTIDGQKAIFAIFDYIFPWPMFLPAITKGVQ